MRAEASSSRNPGKICLSVARRPGRGFAARMLRDIPPQGELRAVRRGLLAEQDWNDCKS